MIPHNPWRGLASYKDPLKSKYQYYFCGRDTEIIELGNLIRNNLFVTLYGRTGVGKTSLLNAGVFPILRQYDYYPLYIRLSQTPANITYAEAIVREIEKSELTIETIIKTNDNKNDSKTYLWSYFCSRKFMYNDKKVYPVIVLDQFEEIFFSEKKTLHQESITLDKAELLLQQISVLLTDDLVLPEGYSDETNYRFVASIREDNLFYLEDCIDNLALPFYKENRYRLRPLNEDNAKKVILIPGTIFIDREDTNDIVEKIIRIVKDKDGTISSLLLSLICSLMYDNAAKQNPDQPTITLQQIPSTEEDANKILSAFYLKCTTKPQRRIIENFLLTEDGHRKPSAEYIPDVDKLLSGSYRILQKIDTDSGNQVEIVHDRMAEVIYKQRTYRDSYKFRNLLRVIVLFFLAICFFFAINLAMGSVNGSNSYSPIAEDLSDVPPTNITLYQTIDTTRIFQSSSIKNVFINENVDSIAMPQGRWKEGLNISVSPKNKSYKWDSIYTYVYGKEYIGYLYKVDAPHKIVYIQEEPTKNKIRIPKGIDSLCLNGEIIMNTPGAPHWGEEKIIIKPEDNIYYLYQHDNKVKQIVLQDIRTIPGKSFIDCKNLTSINLNSVTEIRYSAFEGCEKLREVKLLSKEVKVEHDVFKGCINLESVRLPKYLKGNVTNLFAYCYNLKSVVLPDSIENIDNLHTMFRCCPNIKNIKFHSTNSHFKFDKDSILYYDTIPVIFSISQTKFNNLDRRFLHKDGILLFKPDKSSFQHIYLDANSVDKYHGNPFAIIGFNQNVTNRKGNEIIDIKRFRTLKCYVIRCNNESSLYLPPQGNDFEILGSKYDISEIHTPVGDPNKFSMNINGSELVCNDIVLYVPYGTQKEYISHENFKDFKEIREDNVWKRIDDIISLYSYNLVQFFKGKIWLYPLIIVGLCTLFLMIYGLRLNQMKNNGRVNRKLALKDSLLCIPIAIISFVPVYYMIYIYITNHTLLENSIDIGIICGTFFGCISATLSSYLFVYVGKGKIGLLPLLKRIFNSAKAKGI